MKKRLYITPAALAVDYLPDGLLCQSNLDTEEIGSSGNTIDWYYEP